MKSRFLWTETLTAATFAMMGVVVSGWANQFFHFDRWLVLLIAVPIALALQELLCRVISTAKCFVAHK